MGIDSKIVEKHDNDNGNDNNNDNKYTGSRDDDSSSKKSTVYERAPSVSCLSVQRQPAKHGGEDGQIPR